MTISYSLANWLRQTSSSTGIGSLTMGAAVSSPPSITMEQAFGSAGVTGGIVYSIEDNGVEVEAGVGSYDGPSGVFTRGPTSTLVGGVYSEGSPTPVNLAGPVIVRVTLNSSQFKAVLGEINTKTEEAPPDSLPKTRVNDGATPVWANERVVPDGGVENEIIIKNSPADGDAEWGHAPVGFPAFWRYDDNTLEGDPTDRKFRMNNADKALATEFYVSDVSDSGLPIGDLLKELRAGQDFFVNQTGSINTLARYELTANPVDNTTWTKLEVTFIAEATTSQFQDGKRCEFAFLGVGGGANTAVWGGIVGTLSDQGDLQGELNAKEDGLGNPSTDGYILSSTIAGVRSWIAQGGGGGIPEPADALFGYLREGGASNSWVRGSRVFEQSTAPTSPSVGDIWIDTT